LDFKKTLMNAEELSIRALKQELHAKGYAGSLSRNALSLGSCGLRILTHETEFKSTIYGFGASVVFETWLEDQIPLESRF